MDERNTVQYFEIVPFDSRDYMRVAFETVWGTPDRLVTTAAVYTDNPKSDRNTLLDCFASFEQHQNCSLHVLQDIWHAQKRVLKTMTANHADYKEAKTNLKTIFAKLNKLAAYETPANLKTAFKEWVEQHSDASIAQKLSDEQRILYLGENNFTVNQLFRITLLTEIC